MKKIIHQVLMKIKSGSSFAEALAEHPKTFDRLYINLIRAGEAAGVLDRILNQLTIYLQQKTEMRQFLIASMMYPIIVMLMGVGIVMMMMFYILPRFEKMFSRMDQGMPIMTKILLETGIWLKSYWYIPICSLLLV